MKVLNWIQQEQKTADYHVCQWKTSAFHKPLDTAKTGAAAPIKSQPLQAVSANAALQAEGLGYVPSERTKSNYRKGGFGVDGLAADGGSKAAENKVMSTAYDSVEDRISGAERAALSVLPPAVYSAVSRLRRTVGKLVSGVRKNRTARDRLSGWQSAGRADLRRSKNAPRRQPEQPKRGTRYVSKEEALSMQAENHYLLDSYDRNGQYTTLGR